MQFLPVAASVAAISLSSLQFDPGLDATERSQFQSDLDQIASLPIDGSRIRYFEQIFGGADSKAILAYLNDRVHVIVSPGVDPGHALVPLTGDTAAASDPSGQAEVVATNIGVAIWFQAISDGMPGLGLNLGSETIPVRSSRAGVVQLGQHYGDMDTLLRISTVVHEARHSDCTGGLSSDDVAKLHAKQLPDHRLCGHQHVDCPAGHDYAGLPACDNDPWGAYSVEMIFDATVARACPGCSLQEQNIALALFADSASRVLDIDAELAGSLGAPDMSSVDTLPAQ